MTNVLKRIFVLMVTLALLLSCFAACDIGSGNENESETETDNKEETVVYTLTLKSDKTTATRGETVTLEAFFTAEGKENVPSEETEFMIVSGYEYASVTGNLLKISDTAPDGATVSVQAKEGASYSNTVSVKVSVPLKAITISATTDKPTAGQSVAITKILDPSDAPQTVEWKITEGADNAVMVGDVLMVSDTAAVGTVIKLKAVSGEIESNELTFTVRSSTVEIPATSVTITADTMNPLVGESVVINSTVNPADSTDSITYAITEGADFATMSGNVLVISKTATAGVVVKVVATAGEAKSNELVFTVRDGSIAAEAIEISANNLTPLAGQSIQISKLLTPQNTTEKVEWKLLEGGDKAEMVGDVLVIKNTASEGDVIKVQAKVGAIESNVLEFVVATTEIKATKVTISSEYLNLLAGQSMIINSVIEPADSTEDIVLTITEGAQYASISGNVLVVSENAPAGKNIKVIAKAGSVNSNELVFTVRDTSKPATDVSISADNLTPIAGHSVEIKYTITPADTTDKLVWVILEGSDIAKMAGNVLVVDANAAKDSVIKIKATVGSVESNEVLEFKVRPAVEEVKVESIQLSAKTEVLRGETVLINKIVKPDNYNQPVLWQFVEGAQYATITGDAIIISSEAKTGTKISVKAVAGNVESNVLTFTVQPSQEEINATKFYIDLSKDSFTLDKKGTSATPVLVADVYNYNYIKVTDKELEFRVISGAQYLGITVDGANCKFEDLKGHGTAIVEIRIKGTDIVETAEVNVIVPPDAVILPEVFLERNDIEYSFSKIDHNILSMTNITEAGEAKLPFAPTVRGTGLVCQDLSFSFRHESGATGSDVAVYENGNIIFKKTGKVTVTVTSASGSKIEATTSYNFNINEGYNVNDFRELHLLVYSDIYKGKLPINFVVLEKPVGTTCTVENCYCGNKSYEYGYSLVPPTALKDHKDQTLYEIYRGHPEGVDNGMRSNRIQAVNKGLYINGNDHVIDASQMRIFSQADHNAYVEHTGVGATDIANISTLLSVEPWMNEGPSAFAPGQTFEVKLYNVEVKGNGSVNYDPAKWRAEGTNNMYTGIYHFGISVGNVAYDSHYYIDADGLSATGFGNGFSFTNIVGNGKVRNVYANDIFSTGIAAKESIMTLENVTFGTCGATGIELVPDNSNTAGINNDEKQQITISGTIKASYLNAGNTNYFKNYIIDPTNPQVTVPMIINGNVAGIIDATKNSEPTGDADSGNKAGNAVASHICGDNPTADPKFIFVSLKFINLATATPNHGTVHYPNYQGNNGIITVEQLVNDVLSKSTRDEKTGKITEVYKDTTHQFIEMPIQVTGLGTVGTALFYNQNYGK